MTVLIIDSGIGGFSVLNQLHDLDHDLIYFADSECFPYGNKSSSFIQSRMHDILKTLTHLHKIDYVLLACNTVISSVDHLIEDWSSELNIKILEIIRPTAQNMPKYQDVLLLGTVLTIKNKIYDLIFQEYNAHTNFQSVAMPLVAEAIEAHQDCRSLISKYLSDNWKDPDAILLGCSHYPFALSDIREIANTLKSSTKEIIIIDPALYIRDALNKELLFFSNKQNNKKSLLYYTTGDKEQAIIKIEKFLPKFHTCRIEKIKIDR